uniref:EGF-like domain-containing protein n=1 Tax=Strigamia maritima TaxID=126957 RepID=T1IX92_STRMM
MTRAASWLCLILLTITLMPTHCDKKARPVFTKCGGRFNDTHGYFHTPNFPRRFPVPIRCQWIIEAPAGKAIVVYLTQFYLRAGLTASEHAYFVNDTHHYFIKDIGLISFDKRLLYVKSVKPVLLLELSLDEMANNNMRVMDYYLDVFGFNVTYEIIDQDEEFRSDLCSVYNCTFNGDCYASREFLNYSCQCLPGFYGEKCQFGPYCDPKANVSLCDGGLQCSQ